ncbi:hypothetical protein LEP1GSC202_2189 [Leptospira yanagawae serovar Saopaulo str. Sao Paulo = ATCC 700523]|uniref:Uncharacterized protein n=1 Tax=Leptospira yanagawae serovar Saopaulo str. Sao Paulo = ATCC 700523 TaxID=1249483 RepID=A0A5E8HIN8_9LEPT|nr:hypothetical protein LEP1GSC202_2189 [Leptospira yanagawae serovar Saopaulo str. Sao Paulo = ATCC 700523]
MCSKLRNLLRLVWGSVIQATYQSFQSIHFRRFRIFGLFLGNLGKRKYFTFTVFFDPRNTNPLTYINGCIHILW